MQALALCLFVIAHGVSGCEDQCGCGIKGCKTLEAEAECNSFEHKQLATSECRHLTPANCAGKTVTVSNAILNAQCNGHLGPAVATTIATAALAWLAWVPLLVQIKYYHTE